MDNGRRLKEGMDGKLVDGGRQGAGSEGRSNKSSEWLRSFLPVGRTQLRSPVQRIMGNCG